MLKNILLHYPKDSSSAKLYFPQDVLENMNWNVDTPLFIKEFGATVPVDMYQFGVTIYKNMMKASTASYLASASFYTAPYLSLYRIKNIERTYPIECSHLINRGSYPPKLNIMFPTNLKMFFYEPMFEEPLTA